MQNDRWLNEGKTLGGLSLNLDYLEGFIIKSHQAHFSSLGPLGDLRLSLACKTYINYQIRDIKHK